MATDEKKSKASGKKRRRRRRRKKGGSKDQKVELHVPRFEQTTLDTKLVVGVFPVFGIGETKTLQVLPIYRPKDFLVITTTSDPPEWYSDFYTITRYPAFQIKVGDAIERLDLLGFTASGAESAFEDERKHQLADELAAFDQIAINPQSAEPTSRYKILLNISAQAWLQEFKTFYKKGIWRRAHLNSIPRAERDLAKALILDPENPFGFPCKDQRHMLRLALEALPEDADLTLHCFMPWGVDGETVYDQIKMELMTEAGWFDSTVVLTEGKTDSEILNQALRVIRSNLAPYFHFMQFSEFGVAGGASQLVNVVRAFAASGIRNKVIALFDNDTAGHAEMTKLQNRRLPENFRAIALPDIEMARNYPTIGPTEPQEMDVNGKAASIELYFGKEALKDETGKLTPVQWTGYNRKMNRYQGEVLDKDGCQKRVKAILNGIEEGQQELWRCDLEGFDAIFDALVRAFHQ